MTKALILAAGLGSRLKHKTVDRPKALTDVAGKPILGYQIDALLANNIDEIAVVLGYRGEMIKEYLALQYPQLEVAYATNPVYDASNSSYSFWMARELVESGGYVHLNCDILFSKELLAAIVASPHQNVVAVRTDVELGDRMENVVLDGDRIARMSLENTPEAVGKAYGLAKFGPAAVKCHTDMISSFLDAGDKNQNYYGMIRKAVHIHDYHAFDARGYLLQEVNTVEDYERAEEVLGVGR